MADEEYHTDSDALVKIETGSISNMAPVCLLLEIWSANRVRSAEMSDISVSPNV